MPQPLLTLAEGVHVHVPADLDPARAGWCLSNSGVIADGGEVLVVDTGATERRARALRAAVAAVAPGPVSTVVNTHFHGDHTFGNFVFRPEATIVQHEGARAEAEFAGLHMSGLWPEVEWGALSVSLGGVTFRDTMTVHVGELRVELVHPGLAHTGGDAVVWVPERSVLFTGDVVMSGATPFCLMGSISGSLRAVELLRGLGARTLVSGHGQPGGPELFDVTESYLRWVQGLAADGVRRGIEPLALARETDLGEFAGLQDPERLVGNLHRAYAEERGLPEGAALDVVSVFYEMAELHGGPLTCLA
ncbi:MBL fold metallo-hydrolase [Actinokineospora sp. G85]|uniref:MBL fold metallo-hydrolase n=1 Tax=Actinokineospora sp. G85 TaxID=3406626 RepID=UPI003C79641A